LIYALKRPALVANTPVMFLTFIYCVLRMRNVKAFFNLHKASTMDHETYLSSRNFIYFQRYGNVCLTYKLRKNDLQIASNSWYY